MVVHPFSQMQLQYWSRTPCKPHSLPLAVQTYSQNRVCAWNSSNHKATCYVCETFGHPPAKAELVVRVL